MYKYFIYYGLAVAFAAVGLFVEELNDDEVSSWPLLLSASAVFVAAIGVGFSSKVARFFSSRRRRKD